jgi:hypothetical protein
MLKNIGFFRVRTHTVFKAGDVTFNASCIQGF